MESKPDKKIEDKSNPEPIDLRIDNIIQSFQEVDRIIEQLVADNKAFASSLK
jgi:hypothetical protein